MSIDADQGLIRVVGADAATFLQSQLTNDVASLDVGRAALAGWCSAKGRLLVSFVVWRPAADEFLLACSRDLLAAVTKRLSMFVLRAKCSVAAADLSLEAACGEALPTSLRAAAPMGMHDGWLRLPDVDGTARAWRAVDKAARPDVPPAEGRASSALELWRWLEVRSGVPRIVASTADLFVPQMVNLELIGGVNFRKGCYPGQEVVARSQYRGTLKRRMFLFAAGGPAVAGQEVFHGSDASQPSGTVVGAASRQTAQGREHVTLVSLKSALLDTAGAWTLGQPDGLRLSPLPMPYAVPREAETV